MFFMNDIVRMCVWIVLCVRDLDFKIEGYIYIYIHQIVEKILNVKIELYRSILCVRLLN